MLAQQVDKVTNTIIVLGVNFGYCDMLLSMICRLQKLKIDNYVVAAFDRNAADFCMKHGIPFFISDVDQSSESELSDSLAFGTTGFRRLTKFKSQQVLRVLRKGYNVLWTDVDIYWFKNPIPYLMSRTKDISIQSNAPITEIELNGWNRVNSGFYFAWSKINVIKAFEKIVQHANSSKYSEQPSFYSILCDENMLYRLESNQCYNPTIDIHTLFLDRKEYVNGNSTLWSKTDLLRYGTDHNVFIAHNNWIKGHEEKMMRFKKHKMWLLDSSNECIW